VVDDQILPPFCIHKMFVAVKGRFEKIGHNIFQVFFAFAGGMVEVLEQADQFSLKMFQWAAGHILDAIGREQGFGRRMKD
jgi:hypothetical protein